MTPWIRWDAQPADAEPAWRWLAHSLGMPALLATPARPLAELAPPQSRLPEAARQKLSALLGDGLRLDDQARLSHAAIRTAADQLRLRGGDVSAVPDAVVCPRSESDLLGVLRICAETDVAIGKGGHAASIACDLSGMAAILSLDAISGTATLEGGISSAELARQLAARGMCFDPAPFSTLDHWVRQGIGTQDVMDVRVSTPQGILPSRAVPGLPGNFGIVTAATLRLRALPAATQVISYRFPDFASGLAAAREMQRESVEHTRLDLWDAEETRFHHKLAAMAQTPSWWQRLRALYDGQSSDAAALCITLSGSAGDVEISRKRAAGIAKRLGAQAAAAPPKTDYRPQLLDRGVTVDRICASASWSKLPALYAGLRHALDQAMRSHAPRSGAHGLVLIQITGARHDGADLICTLVYPRQLNKDVAQAAAIRQAATDVLQQPAESELQRAIQALLDPNDILG